MTTGILTLDGALAAPPVIGWVTEEVGKHALLRFRLGVADVGRMYTGQLLTYDWGDNREQRRFYGYVFKRMPALDGVDVLAVGETMWLKREGQNVFRQRTTRQIVEQVVKSARLSPLVLDPPSEVIDVLPWGGESAWQFLVALARRSGRLVAPWGTTVLMAHPASLRKYDLGEMPTLVPSEAKVHQSEAPVGDEGMAGREAYALNDLREVVRATAPVMGRQKTPLFVKGAAGTLTTAASSADLRRELGYEQTRNLFPYRADVLVRLSPRVRPLQRVFVQSSTPAVSGIWTVMRAEHEVRRESPGTTRLRLARDVALDNGERPWTFPAYQRLPQLPPTRLREGRWEAEWA